MAGIYDIDTTLTAEEEREEEIKEAELYRGKTGSPDKKNKFGQDALEGPEDDDYNFGKKNK